MIACVSGATGFIGRRVAKYHLESNDEVRYLTRTNNQPISGAEAFVGDVNAPVAQLLPLLRNVNMFYQCAGEVENELVMRNTHVQGTSNLLNAIQQLHMHSQEIFHWIQLSSCGAYGQLDEHPSKPRYVNEDTPENPKGEYEETKTEADQLIVNFAKKNDWFKYTVVRPTNVFGDGMRSTAIAGLAKMVRKKLFFYIGGTDAIANFVHVDDVVMAMVLSAHNKEAFNQKFIVSNDCAFDELINVIADALGSKRPRLVLNEFVLRWFINIVGKWAKLPINNQQVDVMMRQTHYRNTHIKEHLNWAPKASVLVQMKTYINATHG